MAVGLLAGSTVAHAATTEVQVVSAFASYDPSVGIVDPNTGWGVTVSESGRAEIGSAYGAPAGLGRGALMLDTPRDGDSVEVHARTDQGELIGAFPDMLRVAPDQRLGFWLYRSGASTSGSSPVLEGWIGMQGSGSGFGYAIATFDPVANGYTELDTWVYVDATDAEAVWSVRKAWSDDPAKEMTWSELIDHTRGTYMGQDVWGGFEYGPKFLQDDPGTFSAIDGITASTTVWSSVTDFERRPTTGQPILDTCKNDGWRDNYPTNPFKNQGDCVASIVAAN
jgi:hypothetical protein